MLNEATSEIRLYAAANPHMALLDTASLVTDVRSEDVLSDWHTSFINSAKGVKTPYNKAEAVTYKLLRNMSHSPVESTRMCGYMMTAKCMK